ncbi:hypothetical protein ANANG_G00120840 [Anguilla anguilla]|uniref:KASH domain-containing protein n=1 Tax=Anguilla anguilla TaxID=7936 RepID=A0A9D3RXM1_ANGAN|nr:hypothetical protein ANANG_G00120840 [Anguilla anguilla]
MGTNTQGTGASVCEKKVVSILLDVDRQWTATPSSKLLPQESKGGSFTESSGDVQLAMISGAKFRESSKTERVDSGPGERTGSASAETAAGKAPPVRTETQHAEPELQGTTETLQPRSTAVALVLDTNALHIHTPEAGPSPHADVLRILSSGGADIPAAEKHADAQRAPDTVAQTSPPTNLRVKLTGTPETHGESQSSDAACLEEVPEDTARTDPTRLQEAQAHTSQNQPSQTLWTEATGPDKKKRAEHSGSLGQPDRIISAQKRVERGAEGPFPEGHRQLTVEVKATFIPSPRGQDRSQDLLSGSSGLDTFTQVQNLPESMSHITEMERATARLDQIQKELIDCSEKKVSLDELQSMLGRMKQCQHQLENESHTLAALERSVSRLLDDPTHQGQAAPFKLCQQLQGMQDRCKKLREKCMLDQQTMRSEVQEWEQAQKEIRAVRERLVTMAALLSKQGQRPSTRKVQEARKDLDSQNAVLQSITSGLKNKYLDKLVPTELETPLQEARVLLKELQGKAEKMVEKSSTLSKLSCKVTEVMEGLQAVQDLLQQKSPSLTEAQYTQKCVWDKLDRWHAYLAELEGEVQDISEEQPEQAQFLMDKLMEPLQLYQDVAKQAEQRTAFLSKVPTLLQEYEEMIGSSNRWLREAQSWLDAPIIYKTAKCLSSYAQGLQEKLLQTDQRMAGMQQAITGPLSRHQYAASEVEAMEREVKLMEGNVTKIKSILSSIDTTSISPEEHLMNRQVILDNIQSMKSTIAEIQRCRSELELPKEASKSLSVFHRTLQLLQPIQGLEQLTQEQSATLQAAIEQSMSRTSDSAPRRGPVIPSLVLSVPGYHQGALDMPQAGRKVEEEARSSSCSSSETLTGSVTEDPGDICTGEGYAGAPSTVSRGAGVTAGGRFDPLMSSVSTEVFEPCPSPSPTKLMRESGLAYQGEDAQLEGVKQRNLCQLLKKL